MLNNLLVLEDGSAPQNCDFLIRQMTQSSLLQQSLLQLLLLMDQNFPCMSYIHSLSNEILIHLNRVSAPPLLNSVSPLSNLVLMMFLQTQEQIALWRLPFLP